MSRTEHILVIDIYAVQGIIQRIKKQPRLMRFVNYFFLVKTPGYDVITRQSPGLWNLRRFLFYEHRIGK